MLVGNLIPLVRCETATILKVSVNPSLREVSEMNENIRDGILMLVHISDMHCGPKLEKSTLQRAIDEINTLSPDIVVVTGDLTEDGLTSEFQEAKRYLTQLKCEHIVVGSGNHDSRTTGYLLFPKFFGEPSSVTEVGDTVLIMLNSSRPDREDGEIGYNQGLWLKGCLNQYKDKFKIVSLHHHLIPVPDTGMERNTVSDAGDLLRTLILNDVNLVLCGHRHRPWMWEIGNLPIIYAGAISTKRLRGFYHNAYGIIQINNRKIKAKLKVVGNEEYDFDKIFVQTNDLTAEV